MEAGRSLASISLAFFFTSVSQATLRMHNNPPSFLSETESYLLSNGNHKPFSFFFSFFFFFLQKCFEETRSNTRKFRECGEPQTSTRVAELLQPAKIKHKLCRTDLKKNLYILAWNVFTGIEAGKIDGSRALLS